MYPCLLPLAKKMLIIVYSCTILGIETPPFGISVRRCLDYCIYISFNFSMASSGLMVWNSR